MVSDLYNQDILSLSASLRNERLAAPDGTARAVSKLCGSSVEVDVEMDGERVAKAALRVQACALGQASAAILKKNMIGATFQELSEARDELRAMLKSDGEISSRRFAELSRLRSVRSYPARHQSTLLAFEAAVQAVEDAMQRTTSN